METKQTRRNFLRNGLLVVTGSSVVIPTIAGSIRSGNEEIAK